MFMENRLPRRESAGRDVLMNRFPASSSTAYTRSTLENLVPPGVEDMM
jgi:hypothetical protein